MSFSIIPNWVIRDTDLTAHELLVYIALLNRADKYGRAWPSIKTIARESRTSTSSVRRTLGKLRDRGLVTWEQRKRDDRTNASNVYRVGIFERDAPHEGGGFHRGTPTLPVWRDGGATVDEEVDPLEVEPGEEDMRVESADSTTMNFEFVDDRASAAQLAYMHDLNIHLYGSPPSVEKRAGWAALSREQATDRITRLLRVMPRDDEYEGPQWDDESYAALSPVGQEFADRGFVP